MYSASVIVGVCLVVVTSNALEVAQQQEGQNEAKFKQFIRTYNKVYATDAEYKNRFEIFVKNMKIAEDLQKNQLGTATYGVTKFSDLTAAEFSNLNGMLATTLGSGTPLKKAIIPNVTLPINFDWRPKGVVTDVKNQGHCKGGGWAFAVTGNIEALYAIKHKTNATDFSVQESIDCDKDNRKCDGGIPSIGYDTLKRLGGLEEEHDYPYVETPGKCKFDPSRVVVQIHGSVAIAENEVEMAKWLYTNAPIAVELDARRMQYYKSGVDKPSESQCNYKNINHAALIVGFGVDPKSKDPFWLIKNSFGNKWGEKGYYRLLRGAGCCGVNHAPTSAEL